MRSDTASMSTTTIIVFAAFLAVGIFAVWRLRKAGRPVPAKLRRGQTLPAFEAVDESGNPVDSEQLRGSAAVILFVRGNWCPFCTKQVEHLTVHYKDIVELGAKLILVTPKPLETTRRVAEFFEVEFDFWLDEDLKVARELGLLQLKGVPKGHREEYGDDTVWPTAVVVDRDNVIRYTELSKFIADRPNPEALVSELRLALAD